MTEQDSPETNKKNLQSLQILLFSVFQWLDYYSTQAMVGKHGVWVEDNPRADYFFSNPDYLESLKLLAVPVLGTTIFYLLIHKYTRFKEPSYRLLILINIFMACVVSINTGISQMQI